MDCYEGPDTPKSSIVNVDLGVVTAAVPAAQAPNLATLAFNQLLPTLREYRRTLHMQYLTIAFRISYQMFDVQYLILALKNCRREFSILFDGSYLYFECRVSGI